MQVKTGFEDRKARVEFLPLMDVVFLLLVFFVYAMLSMVVHRGIEVTLPSGGTTQISQKDYVNITISADNQISVDGVSVSLDTLVAQVQQATAQAKHVEGDVPIFIAGDRAAGLGVALKVLDHLRGAGFGAVSFELQQDKP
jgi:biopolymer transport protein ExbD